LTSDLVFDARRKTIVELPAESAVAPSTDNSGKAVELDDVLSNPSVISHAELFKARLSVTNRVMWSEILDEFRKENLVVI